MVENNHRCKEFKDDICVKCGKKWVVQAPFVLRKDR